MSGSLKTKIVVTPQASKSPADEKPASASKSGEGVVWNYEKINRIGEGTYGIVYRARHRTTGKIVALKKVRMDRERDGMPITALRELKILKMSEHPNIVNLLEVVTGSCKESIFLVFEYCEHDLGRLLDSMRNQFTEGEVKCLMQQLLAAVQFLHRHWIVHRDLKLSNLLFTNTGYLKLCDFGLARFVAPPAQEGSYTPKVVTLWYRAPELLLGSSKYDSAVDVWAAGCILAELLLHEPLFPGQKEIEMLELIANLLGNFNERIWPGVSKLPLANSINLPTQQYSYLKQKFPRLSAAGVDLLDKMLTYDPAKRLTAAQALAHPYFSEPPFPKPRSEMPTFPTAHDQAQDRAKGPGAAAAAKPGPARRPGPESTLEQRFGSIFGNDGAHMKRPRLK